MQYSIIEQGKSREIKTELKQVATRFKTILNSLEDIKTKYNYILATESKTKVKPVF